MTERITAIFNNEVVTELIPISASSEEINHPISTNSSILQIYRYNGIDYSEIITLEYSNTQIRKHKIEYLPDISTSQYNIMD